MDNLCLVELYLQSSSVAALAKISLEGSQLNEKVLSVCTIQSEKCMG
jgi:hypothetical protein